MRSPDGLAFGHNTPENQKILSELVAEAQPRVPRKQKEPEQPKTLWDDLASPGGKNLKRNDAIQSIKTAIDTLDTDKSFTALYDTLSLEQAIAEYSNPKHAQIIDQIDSFVSQGLGRGELVFLFLLKGAKSGGTKDVDLMNVDGGKSIELKEQTSKDIKISMPTLKGLFDTTFMISLGEIVTELRKNPKMGEFLIRVLKGDSPELYPGDRKAEPREVLKFTEFIEKKNITEMSGSVFTALSLIGTKLKIHDAKKGGVSTKARAAVVVGNKRTDFKINDPVAASAEVDKINTDPSDDSMTLKVSPSPEKGDKELEEDAKDLKYFNLGINRKVITDELMPLIRAKFDGLLVIDKTGGNKASYVEGDNIQLEFVATTINKLMFKVK